MSNGKSVFGGKGWDGVKLVQKVTNDICQLIDSGSDVFALSGTSRNDLESFDLPCEVNLNDWSMILKNPHQKLNPWAVDSVTINSNRHVKIFETDYIINGLCISSACQDAPYVSRQKERDALEASCGKTPHGDIQQLQVHNQFGKLKFQHTPISQDALVSFQYMFVGENGKTSHPMFSDPKREGDWIKATVRVYGIPVEGREQKFTYTSFDTPCIPKRLDLKSASEFSTTHKILPIFKSSCLLLKIQNDYVALASALRKEPSKYSIEFHGSSWGNEITINKMTVSEMMREAQVFEESGGVLPVNSFDCDGSNELWLVMPLLSEEQLVQGTGEGTGEGTGGEGLKWWNITDIKDINSLMFCGKIDEMSLIFTRNDEQTMGGFTKFNVECYWWQYNTFKTVHNGGAWSSMFDKDASEEEHRASEGVGMLYV